MNPTLSRIHPLVLIYQFVRIGLLLVCLVLYAAFPETSEASSTRYLSEILFVASGGLTSGTCGSWGQACELRYALQNAGSGDELWVKAGIYTPTAGMERTASFQLKNGTEIYGGYSGNESDRIQRNPAANLTILSGEIGAAGIFDNSYHVVDGSGTDATAVLDGFTISDGNASGASPDHRVGGGMVNSNGSPTVSNVTFSGNIAGINGGGMFNGGISSPVLNNVIFRGNSASQGGGMFNLQGGIVLNNVIFWNNSASTNGGGMFNGSNSSPVLNNVTFSNNTASLGGGMYNTSDSSPIINNSILWDNTPDQIYNEDISSAMVSYSDVQGGYPGTGNIDVSPLFVDAPSGNLRLPATSPAIDAGNNSLVPSGVIYDLAGNRRIVDYLGVDHGPGGPGYTVDMGAYELQQFWLYLPKVSK